MLDDRLQIGQWSDGARLRLSTGGQPTAMRLDRTCHRRWFAALLAPLVLAGGLAACDSDDDALTNERSDLNEDFGSVPGATVDSPALAATSVPTGAAPPFGTVSVAGEVYAVDGMVDDGGDFSSCVVEPPDREGYVDIAATLDERTFAFTVIDGNASAAVEADTTVVDDVEIDGSSVRGTAEFDAGTVVFDITC